MTFGPGYLEPGFCFNSPGFPSDRSVDLTARNLLSQAREPGGPIGGFSRFCHSDDFHGSWAWNSEDVTDPARHEYGIYQTHPEVVPFGSGRVGRRRPPVKVASTFREFVLDYALADDLGGRGGASGANDLDESGKPGLIPFRQTRF